MVRFPSSRTSVSFLAEVEAHLVFSCICQKSRVMNDWAENTEDQNL